MSEPEIFQGWNDTWMEMRAQPAPWWGGIELYARAPGQDGHGHFYIKDVVMERVTDHDLQIPPTLKLNNQKAQVLMDDLWASGIRPSEKRDMGGALSATERHLEDMQKLTFRLLDSTLGESQCPTD